MRGNVFNRYPVVELDQAQPSHARLAKDTLVTCCKGDLVGDQRSPELHIPEAGQASQPETYYGQQDSSRKQR